MDYEVVIGLEVHCELKTESKIFCACPNGGDAAPNTNVCPVCLGYPGMLPVLNKKAVQFAVTAGLALNCKIERVSEFDRKNYFYPDLPKAYQITQFYRPICTDGYAEFKSGGEIKRARINRIHIEEDAGKLVHAGGETLIDYNRGGVPLIEIVTEPDLKSPEDAVAFLETLRNILIYGGVSDAKMEKGMLRCDVNLSLNKKGAPLGTRTEMKNLNSFKAAYRSMQYEIKRQKEILDGGGAVAQETRRWDDGKNKSFAMRGKEDAIDYRYFADPDLAPVVLEEEFIDKLRAELPELPEKRRARYVKEFALPEYDAEQLTADKDVSDFFEACVKIYNAPKTVSNWIMGDVARKLKAAGGDAKIPLAPRGFAALLKMHAENKIGQNAAKQVFEIMWDEGGAPAEIVEKRGLAINSDTGELRGIITELIKNNPRAAADFKGGNAKTAAFFVGQVMKATKGKADPAAVNKILAEELSK